MQRPFHPYLHVERHKREFQTTETEENYMYKQGQSEFTSTLPFVANWI